MGDLSMLRKADRSRLKRRAIVPEDGLVMPAPGGGFSLRSVLRSGLFPVLTRGAFFYALAVLVFRPANWWKPNLPMAVVALGVAAFFVGKDRLRQRKNEGAERGKFRRDLDSRQVDEVTFPLIGAKAFRFPDQGKRVHVLLLNDGRVFVDSLRADETAQAQEDSPNGASHPNLPRRTLHLLFGTESGKLVGWSFSGELFKPDGIVELIDIPKSSPPPGNFWAIDWDRIELEFSTILH